MVKELKTEEFDVMVGTFLIHTYGSDYESLTGIMPDEVAFCVICNLLWQIKCEQISYSDLGLKLINTLNEEAANYLNELTDEWIEDGLTEIPFPRYKGITINNMQQYLRANNKFEYLSGTPGL